MEPPATPGRFTIVREGLKTVLLRDERLEVVGEAADGREAVGMVLNLKPDLVIMDIAMPQLTGVEATKEIMAALPSTMVIILSVHSRKTFIMESLKAGARGYVVKNTASRKLLDAVEAVLQGESYLDSPVASHIISEFVKLEVDDATASPNDPLTRREREVLKLIVEGGSVREVAKKLFISPKTVDNHRANIMSKLGLHNIIDLVKYAIATDLVDLDPWKQ
ncbi:MAG: response regulator transcription factor [Deltaproteobacteria bacterium]|nr:response regulator transcription factor [Deltaproteobacteria bacterium]